jgi:hypothetical protein
MIATIISGGIGNQLFMYAAARSLSIRMNTGLVLNTEKGFRNDYTFKRNFELSAFNLNYTKNRKLTFDTIGSKVVQKISRFLGVNILNPSYKILHDSTENHDIDPRFFNQKRKNIFLEGYWQSEEYFKDYEDIIRSDLQFKFEKSLLLKAEESQIFATEDEIPVCVGVRRYQECNGPLSFAITDESYYTKAMDYMCSYLKNPVFYVFTQDKEWVINELNKKGRYKIRFIKDKNNSTIEDLYLMSRFKYHIISNSSYYWWGAWLANGNIVISNNNFINKASNCKSWIIL